MFQRVKYIPAEHVQQYSECPAVHRMFSSAVHVQQCSSCAAVKCVMHVQQRNAVQPQPTTFDHINIKYVQGPHVNHIWTPR